MDCRVACRMSTLLQFSSSQRVKIDNLKVLYKKTGIIY